MSDAGAGTSDGLRARSEQAIGEIAQALIDSPTLHNAISAAFGAREKAIEAQQAAMAALNLPSAGDVERLERRLRSFSQRLEDVEEQLDDLAREIGDLRRRSRRAPKAAAKRGKGLTLDLRVRVRRPAAARPAALAPPSSGPRRREARPALASVTIRTAASATPSSRPRGEAAPRSACRRRRPRAGAGCAGGGVEDVEAGDRAPARRLRRRAPACSRAGQAGLAGAGPAPRRRGRAADHASRLATQQRRRPQPRRERRAGPDPDRPPHPQLGQVGEHQGRARPAHPGCLDGQPGPPAVVPE